jgi:SagB-type dehydrogenase family enzyme
MATIRQHRDFMKSNFESMQGIQTDQAKDLPQPPLEQPYDDAAEPIQLPAVDPPSLTKNDLYRCLKDRRSRREFSEASLSLSALSFLLWCTQGVEQVLSGGYATLRPAPSGGARHPFETHLIVSRVTGLAAGVYRYLPLSHQLLPRFQEDGLSHKIVRAACGQRFVGRAAVVFVWSCVPYRGEWRYHLAAHKTMLLDAGHLCQNLYLGCEALGCATCAVAAYDQEAVDRLLRLDGNDEFVVYMAPVGKCEDGA